MSQDAYDFVPLLDFYLIVAHRRHELFKPPTAPMTMVSPNACVEPASYRDALVNQQSVDWQKAMQTESNSLTNNQTPDLVPLNAGRRVVNGI
jgi:hypothetical protein